MDVNSRKDITFPPRNCYVFSLAILWIQSLDYLCKLEGVMMSRGIIVFGANGSGKSTLGHFKKFF